MLDQPPRPARPDSAPPGRYERDGSIAQDPRAQRSGNVPRVFEVAHWLRDERLRFGPDAVLLDPSPTDPTSGRFTLAEEPPVDVLVVGGGIAGLSAAWRILQVEPQVRIRVLDARPVPGGNAAIDAAPPLPHPTATGGAYASVPSDPQLAAMYADAGIDPERWIVPGAFYSYLFDDACPWIPRGTRRWVHDVYRAGIRDIPGDPSLREQLVAAHARFTTGHDIPDPPDDADPRWDALAGVSFAQHVAALGLSPAIADFYTRFSIDALGGTSDHVNAHSMLAFLRAEAGPIFAPPGGTGAIAAGLVRHLRAADLRSEAIVLRVDAESGAVTWYDRGTMRRCVARQVVIAAGFTAARTLLRDHADASRMAAWGAGHHVPVVTANVLLRRAAPLLEAGLGYNSYWWGSRYWADFAIADWTGPRRDDPDRPVALTFYGGNLAPPERLAEERVALHRTPMAAYEASLREDLTRLLAGTSFDPERDIGEVLVYRWGHGMVLATPGSVFGVGRRAPRLVGRERLGRVSFAGQDTEGTPSMESAFRSGMRAAEEVLGVGVGAR